MSKRDFLRSNTGIQDPLHFSTENNLFAPSEWATVNNHIQDRRKISPKLCGDFGSTSTWSLPKVADAATFIRIDFTLPQITALGTGATYAAYQDWAAFSTIDQIVVTYAGNKIQTLLGEDLVEMVKSFATEEEMKAEAELSAGELALGARYLRAIGGSQIVRGRLPLFFAAAPSNALHIGALSHELTIDVTWKTLANSVESDGTTAPTAGSISAQYLEVNYIHMTPEDRSAVLAGSTQEHGFVYSFLDIERQRASLANDTQTTSFDISLTAIRNPASFIQVALRKTLDLQNSSPGNNKYYDYLSLAPTGTLKLSANGSDLWSAHTHKEIQEDVHNKYWPHAQAGELLYKIPFAWDPSNRVHATGSVNLANVSNPVLTIVLPSNITNMIGAVGSGNHITVDVKAWVRNTIQHRSGDLQKNFT